MQLFIIVFIAVTNFSMAHAQGVTAAVTSNYSNPKDLKGLCTMDNKDELYFKSGDCQSLKEQLTADKCTADLLEKLRMKMVKQADANSNIPANQRFTGGQLENCRSRNGGTGWDKIIKNKQVFGTVVMQFFMSVAIAESNLDTFNGLSKASGVNINANAKGGLMNLTLDQMEEPKYNKNKCGCTNTNSPEIDAFFFWRMLVGSNAHAAMTVRGRAPGPRDDHHSLQCGTYMALVEAEADGVLFEGHRRVPGAPQTAGNNDNKPKGAAKIFASLQDWETPPGAPIDPDKLAENKKLDFILKKMKTYCEKNLNENGGLNRTFDQDFPGGGTSLSDTIAGATTSLPERTAAVELPHEAKFLQLHLISNFSPFNVTFTESPGFTE